MFGVFLQAVGMGMKHTRAKRDARLLRAQGRVAEQQSVQDAEAMSREYRQLAGRQAASIAQSGGGYEGSAAKLLHQSETLAFLDRLNVRYHGRLRRAGLVAEGRSLKKQADAELIAGLGSLASGVAAGGA